MYIDSIKYFNIPHTLTLYLSVKKICLVFCWLPSSTTKIYTSNIYKKIIKTLHCKRYIYALKFKRIFVGDVYTKYIFFSIVHFYYNHMAFYQTGT